MIAEITAAMSAIKETASLAKIFTDAKTEAEVNAAVSALNSKLAAVLQKHLSLAELAFSIQEENAALKAKIVDFENFQTQTEGYFLNQLESGSLVYSRQLVLGDKKVTTYLCPQCYAKREVSILQPTGDVHFDVHTSKNFHQSICHNCKSLFPMNGSDYKEDLNWNN
ncbi:hypothetical protein C5952_04965 [Cronobacter sakazakii]|uniref:hypothetical protein n=1 Tax=Cronobacter sakazakii TaxID=28141 RepID=UPI000CFC4065|nr:hypothetical protein [Cronobacter sakazakii]ELY6363042.1 hypothetical protein [Cronobacter sakazakii]PQX67359.1 hypothetical protein C5952_04965 [Cronobacter sakazakii]PQY05788.1 hypothetical protein C5936_10905 [Cronobacter sakazakii]